MSDGMSDGLGDGTPEGGRASAYSTGGGGVVLEHAYGGALLADLLLGAPVTGLRDDVTPVRVGFQQSAHSPVDDLMVTGEGPGGKRTLFIGVRRKPVIGAGSKPFVKLMVDYLRVVSEHRAELEAGSWRLGLAVAAPRTPPDEIAALARFARDQPEESELAVCAWDRPSAAPSKTWLRIAELAGSGMCNFAAELMSCSGSGAPARPLTERPGCLARGCLASLTIAVVRSQQSCPMIFA